MSAGQNLTRILGPSLAGAAIGWLGVGEAFVLQAVASSSPSRWLLGVVFAAARSGADRHRRRLRRHRAIAARLDFGALPARDPARPSSIFPYLGFLNVYARDILHTGAAGLGVLTAVSGAGAGGPRAADRHSGLGRRRRKRSIWTTLAYGGG